MSVKNSKVIDAISINPQGVVVLTISDHLEWNDDNEHLIILQDKINVYLEVIESGEIYDIYPDAQDRIFQIEVAFKYSLNDIAIDFLSKVKDILLQLGYNFKYYQFNSTKSDIVAK